MEVCKNRDPLLKCFVETLCGCEVEVCKDHDPLLKCFCCDYVYVRLRYVWIVIHSGCYVLLKAGRNDKETLDHLAVALYYTCHIGAYTKPVSRYTHAIVHCVNSNFTYTFTSEMLNEGKCSRPRRRA